MNIRSLTGFISFTDPVQDSALRALGDLIAAARVDFASAGCPMQTARIATQPISDLAPRDLVAFARDAKRAAETIGVDYVSLGAPPGDHPIAQVIPAAIAATENVFGSMRIASRADGINLAAVSATARVMRALADVMPDGFGNFRFTALANVSPHSPFFPAAYHDGGAPAFALATEAAPLALDAFTRARTLDQARANLVGAIETTSAMLTRVADDLAARFNFRFAGIDFSLAPYPEPGRSIGHAIEQLLGAEFGESGTLFAVAFLTDCIKRANFPRVGFSGVMLPVLEDTMLGARAANYSLDSLLLYSAVCGTGLDTIPLPGNTSADALAAILLDLATLAVKLDKPLTARLVPIAGLASGDLTQFDFEYIQNARVLDARARALRVFDSKGFVQFK